MLRLAVVGSGVAGSAAATLLARAGHEVHVFETVAQPQPLGAGLLIQPTGQAVLEQLGLLPLVRSLGAPVNRLLGDTPSGRTVLNLSYERLYPGAQGLGLQRGALMSSLWAAVQHSGAQWHRGWPAIGWQQGDEGVELRFQQHPPQVFDGLMLANGAFSTLRQAMPVRQYMKPYPWGALWTVLPMPAGMDATLLRQRFQSARQMLGLMPVGQAGPLPHAGAQAGVNLFWSAPAAQLDALLQGDVDVFKRELIALYPAVEPVLQGLHHMGQMRAARYADVVMQRWHAGRVVALGDCAHAMSPQLGQGANLALIDALELASSVAAQPHWPAACAAYSRSRRAHLRYYHQASRWLTPLFQSSLSLLPALRDALMGPLHRIGPVHAQSIATLGGAKAGWLWGRLALRPSSIT